MKREKKKTKDEIYNIIRNRIITLEMKPEEIIYEENFCKEFNVSRTPIREVILRLEQDRLVKIFPRQGTIVAPISLQYFHEVFNIRMLIEPSIAAQGAPMIDKEKLKEYREFFSKDPSQLDIETVISMDQGFHKLIIDSSNNQVLSNFYDSLMGPIQRVRNLILQSTPGRLQQSDMEHVEIIDALLSQDEEKIKECIIRNLESGRRDTVNMGF